MGYHYDYLSNFQEFVSLHPGINHRDVQENFWLLEIILWSLYDEYYYDKPPFYYISDEIHLFYFIIGNEYFMFREDGYLNIKEVCRIAENEVETKYIINLDRRTVEAL